MLVRRNAFRLVIDFFGAFVTFNILLRFDFARFVVLYRPVTSPRLSALVNSLPSFHVVEVAEAVPRFSVSVLTSIPDVAFLIPFRPLPAAIAMEIPLLQPLFATWIPERHLAIKLTLQEVCFGAQATVWKPAFLNTRVMFRPFPPVFHDVLLENVNESIPLRIAANEDGYEETKQSE